MCTIVKDDVANHGPTERHNRGSKGVLQEPARRDLAGRMGPCRNSGRRSIPRGIRVRPSVISRAQYRGLSFSVAGKLLSVGNPKHRGFRLLTREQDQPFDVIDSSAREQAGGHAQAKISEKEARKRECRRSRPTRKSARRAHRCWKKSYVAHP